MHSFPRNPPTHPPPTQVLGHGDPPPPPLPCTTTSVAAAVAEDSLVDLGQRDVVQHGHLPLLRGEVGPESRVLVANLEHRVKRGRGGQVVRLVGEEGRDSEGAQPHREGEGPVPGRRREARGGRSARRTERAAAERKREREKWEVGIGG